MDAIPKDYIELCELPVLLLQSQAVIPMAAIGTG